MADPLEFTASWEAWYATSIRESMRRVDPTDRQDHARSLEVQCLRADHASSYVTFEEMPLGTRTTVRMVVWADGWRILADHPSLFARLAARLDEGCRLEDIVALLTEYGATDSTPRSTNRPTTTKD